MQNRLAISIFLMATFAIVALAGRQATTAPSNVLVTNSTSQAVPVKPASGSSFPAAITNTPNVHAFVTNTAASPVQAAHSEDKNLYRQIFHFTIADTYFGGEGLITVPAGKRLIIDWVDCGCDSDTQGGYATYLQLQVVSGNTTMGFAHMPISGAANFGNLAFGSEYLHLSAEPAEQVLLIANRATSAGAAHVDVTVEGHYVSLP